jgi:hypothetical protein
MSPTTERSVVEAMFSAAPAKFCTLTTESTASTTRWKTMKSISIGALSFVMPGNLEVLLAKVDDHRAVDDRDQEDDARALRADDASEPEDDAALVLANDPDAQVEKPDHEEHGDRRSDDGSQHCGGHSST